MGVGHVVIHVAPSCFDSSVIGRAVHWCCRDHRHSGFITIASYVVQITAIIIHVLVSFSMLFKFNIISFINLCCTALVFCRTEFLITASCDGHIKFWKRQDDGVEFVKHFKAHMGEIIANFFGSVFYCGYSLRSLAV